MGSTLTDVQAAMYRDLVRLVGARYWPSGRRITARDRRRIARFLVEVFG